MVKFKDFIRPLSVFQVLFKANLIFKDFSDSPVYSSTFQACANPVEWSFSYNSFVKLSLYNSLITLSIPIDAKHSVLKGLHCIMYAYTFMKYIVIYI